jgi:hypothetical protein
MLRHSFDQLIGSVLGRSELVFGIHTPGGPKEIGNPPRVRQKPPDSWDPKKGGDLVDQKGGDATQGIAKSIN